MNETVGKKMVEQGVTKCRKVMMKGEKRRKRR